MSLHRPHSWATTNLFGTNTLSLRRQGWYFQKTSPVLRLTFCRAAYPELFAPAQSSISTNIEMLLLEARASRRHHVPRLINPCHLAQ
jgi:hypothetical protein